jgi:hypothetical protein
VKVLPSSLVVCACLIAHSTASLFAQEYPPIGKHYANTITIIAAGSAEDLQMSNGDVADLSGNGLDDVIFTAQEPGVFKVICSEIDPRSGSLASKVESLENSGKETFNFSYLIGAAN